MPGLPGLSGRLSGRLSDLLRLRSRDERALAFAVLVSVVLHAILLSLGFRLPDIRRMQPAPALEVVIVNSKSKSRPAKAEVLAQANLDRGGDTDLARRARTPAPALTREQAGDSVIEAQRRVQQLEAQQRELLAQTLARTPPAPVTPAKPAEVQPEPAQPSGRELASRALAMVKNMEAQVSRQIDEYAKRPKKTFVGVRAQEFRFARYVEDWRIKVERFGNLNYPEAARGKIYGSLRLSVSINADGTLAAVEIDRSSGEPILDSAAERIVRMAAPYAAFPADIRKDTDVLVITRTWHFAQGDRVLSD